MGRYSRGGRPAAPGSGGPAGMGMGMGMGMPKGGGGMPAAWKGVSVSLGAMVRRFGGDGGVGWGGEGRRGV